MNIRPLHDYVIVRRKQEVQVSSGGIVIPDSATEKPAQGEIIAAGNGRILKSGKVVPLIVKPGDKVLFGKHSGTEIKFENEPLLIMHEADIYAVMDN